MFLLSVLVFFLIPMKSAGGFSMMGTGYVNAGVSTLDSYHLTFSASSLTFGGSFR
jgi:hypothetical protein